MPKFSIEVKLSEGSGNAFAILEKVIRALKIACATEEQISEFKKEAKSGNYDHLLQTCMDWVEVN